MPPTERLKSHEGNRFRRRTVVRYTLVLLTVLAIAGCSGLSTSVDYDSQTDFGRYSTFAWIETKPKLPPGRRIDAHLLDVRIKEAVENQLMAKGFRRVPKPKADLLIIYHVGAKNRVEVEHYGYRYGPHGRWVGHRVEVTRYKEGTLIIDIVDARLKELVWRGTAVGAVYSPGDLERKLTEAIRKLFEHFPPA